MYDRLRTILSQRQRETIQDTRLYPAGVLIPLFDTLAGAAVLLTVRTSHVEHHKGEISFPGGAHDEGDLSLQATALRETLEEVGIRPEHVEILGVLDDQATRSNFLITPYVGRIPYPYAFTPSEIEVAELLEVPLMHLLDPASWVEQNQLINGVYVPARSYQYGPHLIFGATARILRRFLELLPVDLLIPAPEPLSAASPNN